MRLESSFKSREFTSPAFTGEHLEEQLEARARLFLNQTRNVRFNSAQREISLSQIFEWYKQDLGDSTEKVLACGGEMEITLHRINE